MKTNVSIRILESDFNLVCDINEKPLLTKSAKVLDGHLRSFRKSNPTIDDEKLLLMGALKAMCEAIKELETLSDQAKIANGEIEKALTDINDK